MSRGGTNPQSWDRDQAMTRAEYLAAMEGRRRPLSDAGIGARTGAKRDGDAEASAIVGQSFGHGELWPGDKPPDVLTNQARQAKCGTCSGYARHSREGTTPCDPCKEAKRNYMREFTARKRKAT